MSLRRLLSFGDSHGSDCRHALLTSASPAYNASTAADPIFQLEKMTSALHTVVCLGLWLHSSSSKFGGLIQVAPFATVTQASSACIAMGVCAIGTRTNDRVLSFERQRNRMNVLACSFSHWHIELAAIGCKCEYSKRYCALPCRIFEQSHNEMPANEALGESVIHSTKNRFDLPECSGQHAAKRRLARSRTAHQHRSQLSFKFIRVDLSQWFPQQICHKSNEISCWGAATMTAQSIKVAGKWVLISSESELRGVNCRRNNTEITVLYSFLFH